MRPSFFVALLLLSACDDLSGSDSEPACVPNESKACACPDGTQSAQTCDADGAGFEACACGGSVPTGYIVGGEVTRSFAATGTLVLQGQTWCTASLIAPELILSAAHCFDSASASSMTFVLGTDPERPAVSVPLTSVSVHPDWRGQQQLNLGADLAVARLARPITEVAPVVLTFSPATDLVGAELTLVGYGASVVVPGAGGGVPQGAGVRRFSRVTVAEVRPETLMYEFRGEGACRGDSGGPAFVMEGGIPRQVGVTSWGDSYCQQYGHYQRIDVHAGWLASVGATANDRALACGDDGTCDGGCEEDTDCHALLCPSGSCTARDGQCARDGTCDGFCGATDPDCGQVDQCQLYGLYQNGRCDAQCANDPECQTGAPGGGGQCVPVATRVDHGSGQCVYVSASAQICGALPLTNIFADLQRGQCVYFDSSGTACGAGQMFAQFDSFAGVCLYRDDAGRQCGMGYPFWDGMQWRC